MSNQIISGKPPLPIPRTSELRKGPMSNRTQGSKLKTSQQETLSDGTILGLKDVIFSNEPDLTYFCPHCKCFVALLALKDHKAYHNALELLDFEPWQRPKSLDIIIQKRNAVVKKLKSQAADGNSLDINQVNRIDCAYERLKQDLEDTFESCRKIEESIDSTVDGFDYSCSLNFVSAVGQCSNQNARWKSSMEDTKVYQDYFGNDSTKAFFALYDGYNGSYAASVAANELHYLLLNEMAKFDSSVNCKCTYNMLEENNISKYDLIRPPSPAAGHKTLLHKPSRNPVQQIIYTCEEPEIEKSHLSTHHPLRTPRPVTEDKQLVSNPSARIKSAYTESMKNAFHQAYKLTDQVLEHGGDEKSRVRWSGCSAVTVVLESVSDSDDSNEELPCPPQVPEQPVISYEDSIEDTSKKPEKQLEPPRTVGRIHLGNTGNCHAMLVRDNRPYMLTKMHTYENNKERRRAENLGGKFCGSDREMRLHGVSLTTRGLGNHGDPKLKSVVTCEPYSHTIAVDQYCQMLVLATAGVWQVFSPQEAAELLLQVLPQNRIPSPGYVSPSIQMLASQEQKDSTERAEDKIRGMLPIAEEKSDLQILENQPETEVHSQLAEESLTAKDANRRENLNEVLVTTQHDTLMLPQEPRAIRKDSVSPSVTFKQEPADSAEVVNESVDVKYTQMYEYDGPEEELDVPLPLDLRSLDSGNEADVDTDWASTIAPNDTSRLSLISKVNIHRYYSRLLSERLVQSALLAGSKENISVIVVLLPGVRLSE